MQTPLHVRASEQGGIVLARDARELGWSWDDFARTMLSEGWQRLFRSAYLDPGLPDTPIARARALQLMRPGLVACFELAALIHGFSIVGRPRLAFNTQDKSRRDVPGGVLSRWLLGPGDVVEVDGLLVTSELRTATDMLRQPDRDLAVIAVDSALRTGALSLDAIAARLERHRGDPGIKRAWRGFTLLDPKSGSPTESKLRALMWDRKIYPQAQVPLLGADGRTYFADFVAKGVVFEAEGYAYHGGKEEHQDDVRRFNALAVAARANGLDFARITYDDAFLRPRQTGDLIVRTINARARRLSR